jgi:hypothetical protein
VTVGHQVAVEYQELKATRKRQKSPYAAVPGFDGRHEETQLLMKIEEISPKGGYEFRLSAFLPVR